MFGETHKTLHLHDIRIDGGTQPRAEINEDAVADYAATLEAGESLPPIVVFHDGKHYWMADGFHRWHAHKTADQADVPAIVHSGTQRDAVLYAVGANADHGLRRTNADKRECVMTLLRDEEWGLWSDREIARQCRVDDKTVAKYRKEVQAHLRNSADAQGRRKAQRGDQQYEQDTSNIGRQQQKEPDPEAKPLADPAKPADTHAGVHGELPMAPDGWPAPSDEQQTDQQQSSSVSGLPDAGPLKEIQQKVQALRGDVKALQGGQLAAYLSTQQIDADLKNVWNALKFAMPHARCPECKGQACKTCRHTGFMPREVYQRVTAASK